MTASDPVAARKKAREMAYALGIALYLGDDGALSQFPPGEMIRPPPGATPTPHGHGRTPEAAATP